LGSLLQYWLIYLIPFAEQVNLHDMDFVQIAIVNQTNRISSSELSEAVAAIQKQVNRDFAPIWNINGTIASFNDVKSVPLGYWPIFVMDNINEPGAAGYHTDQHHQPYSMVQYSDSWTLTLSHETLEMLADPYGNRLVAADSIKPQQGRVQYLLEVCDPSEGENYAYSINGIIVSDFYTPHFFDPLVSPGVRYSFSGKITKPLEVLPGGYLSWYDPKSKQWWQATYFGANITYRKLQGMKSKKGSLRSKVDKLTIVPHLLSGITNTVLLDSFGKKLNNNRVASAEIAKTMYANV
jgi:hypothetical protein